MTRTKEELLAAGKQHISPNYAPADIIFEHGQGVYLYDSEGQSYLDFVAGIAVNCLGYNNPVLTRALQHQCERLLHVSNMFYTREQIELMELLCEHSFAEQVFLCNSGAEANEAAIKLARRYQRETQGHTHKFEILSMKHSFHGRTLAAITATGQPKYHEGFEPMVPGFDYATFNDLEAVKQVGDATAAVIVEPVQGEGGVRPAQKAFLQALRDACDKHGALLIFDEVQTGVGRTGHLFAYQHYGVVPDIMTLAKGLGGGVPVGAMLATERVFGGWTRGSHASTFGGNPLACRAALTVLNVIAEQDLCERASEVGAFLMEGLQRLQERFDVISDVRGLGLMVGIECGAAAGELVVQARNQGLLLNTAGGHTLRMVPPLVVSKEDVSEALERLERAFECWEDSQRDAGKAAV